jgi:hypothetical protein
MLSATLKVMPLLHRALLPPLLLLLLLLLPALSLSAPAKLRCIIWRVC